MVAIGVSTKALRMHPWFEHLKDTGFNTIEINGRESKIQYDFGWLAKIEPFLKGYNLSLHSATQDLFKAFSVFTKTELSILRSEIIICRRLNIMELVFHCKDGILSENEQKQMKEIIKLAEQEKVQLIYESNEPAIAEVTLDFLEKFPTINYNLDLGHINLGLQNKSIIDIDDFLNRVKDRTVYVHAHNNNGKNDEHKALSQGILDWQKALDKLDFGRIEKVIIEVRNKADAIQSRQDLIAYFRKRNLAVV